MFGHSEMDLIKLGEAHDFRTEYERTLPPRPNIHLRREFYLVRAPHTKRRQHNTTQHTSHQNTIMHNKLQQHVASLCGISALL